MKNEQEIEICRKALEKLFKNNREFVKTKRIFIGKIHIFKNRDGSAMDACYIQGNRVIWRVEKGDFVKRHGRWRDKPGDEVITFKTNPIRIYIKE